MTMEPVFAALLAVVVAREVLAPTAWLGGLLVVLAMGTAEIGARECCDVRAPRVECC
jgi:drug/metabolite transporter (DMT)-like permease